MKKILVAAVFMLTAHAFAGPVQFGPHIGIYIPSGQFWGDWYDLSPEFGLHLLFNFQPYAIELCPSYVSLATSDERDLSGLLEWTCYIIPARIGLRKSINDNFYMGAGPIIHILYEKFESTITGVGDSQSSTGFGGYASAGGLIPAGSFDIDLNIKVEFLHFAAPLDWKPAISLTAGINI